MYPRRKDRFVAWTKAMVEGATVDKPVYPGQAAQKRYKTKAFKRSSRRRTRRRKNAKKE